VASGNTASPVAAALTGLAAGVTFHYRVVATNADGQTFGADHTFTTAGTGAGAAPQISSATESNKTWREGANPKPAQVSSKPAPIGTTFKFTLDRSAAVRFAFTQRVPGRKLNGKCVAPTKRNQHQPKCTRTLTRGTLSFTGHVGVNTVKFEGRLSKRKKLKPGKYTLVIPRRPPGPGPRR